MTDDTILEIIMKERASIASTSVLAEDVPAKSVTSFGFFHVEKARVSRD